MLGISLNPIDWVTDAAGAVIGGAAETVLDAVVSWLEDGVRYVATAIAKELGKAFAPEQIRFVAELPKTRSAKIVRRAVRAAALGEDPGDMSSVENPEAVSEIARAL